MSTKAGAMKRRIKAKSGRKTQGKAKRPRRARTPSPKSQSDLQKQNEALKRELREAREQQTATSEALEVVSRSPGDLQPVFQVMLDNATRICGAGFGVLFRLKNGEIEPVALHNVPDLLKRHLAERGPIKQPRPGSTMERVVRSHDVVHVVDVREDVDAANNPAARYAGARTLLTVPMLKENEL